MLTVPKSVEFTPIQLNGEKQNSFGTLGKLMIHDSRNQADGWRLNMTISPFTEPNIAKQLPKGSLSLKNQVSITKVKGPETGKPIIQIPSTPIDTGGGTHYYTGFKRCSNWRISSRFWTKWITTAVRSRDNLCREESASYLYFYGHLVSSEWTVIIH